MFRRVAHNGNENQTDKSLANLGRLDDGIDARDKVVGADGDNNGRGDKDDDGGDEAHAGLLMLALLLLLDASLGGLGVFVVHAVEEVVVGTELEPEVEAVEEEEDDGSTAGEEEDGAFLIFVRGVDDVVELRVHSLDRALKGCGLSISMRVCLKAYCRGNDERSRRQSEQRARRLGRAGGESLLHARTIGVSQVPEAAEEKAHAENEKEVGENGAEHRGLYDFDLAIAKGDNANLKSERK